MLDPNDPCAESALRAWLEVQAELACRPQHAARALRETGTPRAVLRRLRCAPPPRARVDAALATLRRLRCVLLPLLASSYPPRLASLCDPAPLLAVRGDPGALYPPAVAIVGARAATVYGVEVAERLAADLARAGVVVVSGLALGIDAAAHRGALEAGGLTVAVQACGPDLVYPSRHRALAERVAAHGALVSEQPVGTRPLPPYFPLRNRLISGLARAVVVVEARERSGSLITASHALEQGSDVFAVPGPVTAPTSAGPNRLLREGALPALDASDVLREIGVAPRPEVRRAAPEPEPRSEASGPAAALLAALAQEPATRDALARRLGRAPEEIALDLLELQLEGRIAEDRDGRLRVL